METKNESKYERLRKIGIGSYGVVFKCVNRQTGQIVAIKRYSENDSDPIIRKIAMREVRMLRQLKHPNLINLIEVFRRKRRLHLVFDYCELTVLDVIEKYGSNCPLNLIKKIVWQTVNGIDYCHSRNCIHRDIKPENILINQSGVVKLCDFGFARNINNNKKLAGHKNAGLVLRSEEQQHAAASSQDLRQWQSESSGKSNSVSSDFNNQSLSPLKTPEKSSNSGSSGGSTNKENADEIAGCLNFAGSPSWAAERQAMTEYVATRWYRAPELLIGEIYYDTKIDIWAIGCVTAELMRGEPIWPGKSDLDQLCIIKNSLGQLTTSQTHTLLTQSIYDQANIERLLNVSQSIGDSLERKLPPRVGQAGVDFVLACLQMDPARRLPSDELLRHSYIHSSRMTQFLKEEAPAGRVQPQTSSSAVSLAVAGSLTAANGRHLSMADSIQSHFDQVGGLYGSSSDRLLNGGRTNSQSLLLAASSSGSPTKQRQPEWQQQQHQSSVAKTPQVAHSNLNTAANAPSGKQVTGGSLPLQSLALRQQQHQHAAAGLAKSTSSSTGFGSIQVTASSSSRHAKRKPPTANGHANDATAAHHSVGDVASSGANSLSTSRRFSPSSSSSSQSSQSQFGQTTTFGTMHGKSLVPIAEAAASPSRLASLAPARLQVSGNTRVAHQPAAEQTLGDAKLTTVASLTPKHQRSPGKTLSSRHSQSNGNLLRTAHFEQQQQLASSSVGGSKQATGKAKQHSQQSPLISVKFNDSQSTYPSESPSHYSLQRHKQQATVGQASSSSGSQAVSSKTHPATTGNKINADANESMLSMSSSSYSDSLEAGNTSAFLPSVGVGSNKHKQQGPNNSNNKSRYQQQDSSSLATILVPI